MSASPPAGSAHPPTDEPVIVCVRRPPPHDAGEIDTDVYCANTTPHTFTVSTASESFTTVDEEVGTVVEHGSRPTRLVVPPGQAARVADVAGWEWDGYVGIRVHFEREGAAPFSHYYRLKDSEGRMEVPGTGASGRIVPPGKIRPWGSDFGARERR